MEYPIEKELDLEKDSNSWLFQNEIIVLLFHFFCSQYQVVNNLSFQENELKIMTLSSCLKYWFWSYVVLLSSFFSEKVMIFICAPMRTFLFWHFLQNLIWLLWSFESYHSLNLSFDSKGIKKDVVSIPFLICVFML